MTDDSAGLWDAVELPEVALILRDLINAPSPNPPGNCEAVANVCLKWLDGMQIDTQVVRAPDGTPSVICTLGAGERSLLVHSHYDTQPVSDQDLWLSDPYVADLRDNVIYGRGAGDDKGSVAAQLAALRALARSGFDPGYRLSFAFVADEESGGERGTAFLKERGYLDADALLVGEQTNNEVAIGERGIVWLEVGFHGRPAHGAIPSAGISALLPAAAFVHALEHLLAPTLATRQPTTLLPASSMNVGRLTAGIDVSTVPDFALVEIDRRIVPGETVEGCQAEIQDLLETVMERYPDVTTTWSVRLGSPAFLTSSEDPLVTKAGALAIAHGSTELAGYHQASDARYFANDGIPIVIFGPSDPRVGHAANECVSVQQLVDAQALIEGLCRDYRSPDYDGLSQPEGNS